MSKLGIWILSLAAGVLATLMTSILGWLAVGLMLLLFVPVLLRPIGLIALSGLFTGFGGSWLLLLGNQALSGAELDGAGFWVMVGLVPLVVGLAVLAVSMTRARRRGTE